MPSVTIQRIALYTAAVLGAMVIGPRGPIYWDSFGYVVQALTGQVGGLALGRPLFVLVSHAVAWIARAAGVSIWSLEPVLRTFWLAVAALAAPLTHALASACGLESEAALMAGLAVALSPAMAHTSSAVLTDAPSVAMTLLAFVLGVRAVGAMPSWPTSLRWKDHVAALGAGIALGAAFGLREQAIVQGLVLALLVPVALRRERRRIAAEMALGFVVMAAAPVLYVAVTQRGYAASVVGWVRAMERERAMHPYGLRDALAYLGWLLSLGPVVLAAALAAWVQYRRELLRWGRAIFAVTVPSLVQLILLGMYQDISFSPRYLLPALPGAVAIPGAMVLERWMGWSSVRRAAAVGMVAIPLVVSAPVVRAREQAIRATLDALPRALANVPSGSVVVTGQLCPGVALIEQLIHMDPEWRGPRPRWQRVCPGWGWPDDLNARLDRARREGRAVVLDLRPTSWLGPRQRAALEQVIRYERAHRGDAGIVVWR